MLGCRVRVAAAAALPFTFALLAAPRRFLAAVDPAWFDPRPDRRAPRRGCPLERDARIEEEPVRPSAHQRVGRRRVSLEDGRHADRRRVLWKSGNEEAVPLLAAVERFEHPK